MKVVILEDEKSAAENLIYHLGKIDPLIEVERVIDTVSDAVDYFKNKPNVALAFFDIHLADSISFDIFEVVDVNIPIIFTTAYDAYALKAFKVNSIDYLLKPIDQDELRSSILKFKSAQHHVSMPHLFESVFEMLRTASKKHKSTFLFQQKDKLIPINAESIAYFMIDDGRIKAYTFEAKSYVSYEKLDDIEVSLNPDHFFRANRQFIVNRNAITSININFNGKLTLNLFPSPNENIVVSKAKAKRFRNWMNSQELA
jgi:two-component system, LytTR family, response regulator LytT